MKISDDDLALLHELFSKCGPLFIALGDEIRQKLILDILDAGENGVNVMTLAAGSKLSRPAISHHLKILRKAGLIVSRRDGKEIYYKLADTLVAEHIHKICEEVFQITCPLD